VNRVNHPGACRHRTVLSGLLTLLALGRGGVEAHSAFARPVEEPVAAVRAYLDTLEQAGFSGAVLVEFQDKVVISKGYGYSDLSHQRKNSPRTVFDIGSVTKQFTAAAILKLEMEGKLSINDRLTRFFENVPTDKSEITIHHLLRHSSGLRSVIGRDYDSISVASFVDSVMRSPLRFPCGTAFSYSNIGYSLLGIIIERVSGMTYETYLYENLWRPAGMEQTGYRRPEFDEALVATGYDNDDREWGKPTKKQWDVDGPYWHLKGNGGVLSTTEDLYRWHHALATDRVLSEQSKEKMYHPKLRDGEDRASYYAYGWDVLRTPRNTTDYWHNGSNSIFYADFHRFIDESTTVIVLTNKSNGIEGVGPEIAKALLTPGYRPAIPILDTKVNRWFTDHVMSVALQQGGGAAQTELQQRKPGENLLESRVNNRGYELLKEGNTKGALEVFRLNVLAFPKSANTYDSLGEACMMAGDTAQAIQNYKQSLALDAGNMNAVEMMKQLEKQ
jgi:CubicO group peptidase (beta-lactamase class C family)